MPVEEPDFLWRKPKLVEKAAVSNVLFLKYGRNSDKTWVSPVISVVTSGSTHDDKLQNANCTLVTVFLDDANIFTLKVVSSTELPVVYRNWWCHLANRGVVVCYVIQYICPFERKKRKEEYERWKNEGKENGVDIKQWFVIVHAFRCQQFHRWGSGSIFRQSM